MSKHHLIYFLARPIKRQQIFQIDNNYLVGRGWPRGDAGQKRRVYLSGGCRNWIRQTGSHGFFHRVGQTFLIDGKAVIHRHDFNFVCGIIFDGVVSAMVTLVHFHGFCAQR